MKWVCIAGVVAVVFFMIELLIRMYHAFSGTYQEARMLGYGDNVYIIQLRRRRRSLLPRVWTQHKKMREHENVANAQFDRVVQNLEWRPRIVRQPTSSTDPIKDLLS